MVFHNGERIRECAGKVFEYVHKGMSLDELRKEYGPSVLSRSFKLLMFEHMLLRNAKRFPAPHHFGVSKYGNRYIAKHGYILIAPSERDPLTAH